MIHHVSLPARDPAHVAAVLVELFGGLLTGFGPYGNSYIAWMGDAHGTAIEVFPTGTEMVPDRGAGQANFRHVAGASPFTATHVAMSVDRTRAEIHAIAQREGWRAIELSRGANRVIEFWIENSVMIELMTPDMARDYVVATQRSHRVLNNSSPVRACSGLSQLSLHPEYMKPAWEQLSSWIAEGHLRPQIGHVMPLDKVGEAFRLMLERKNYGKIVLKV